MPYTDIKMDSSALAEKNKVMQEMKTNSKLYSTAETFQFMAAALLPVGLASTIAAANAMGGLTLATFGAALTTAAPAIFLGAAAIATAVAITSRYMAARHYQNATFNSTELNAQHTAKYLAQELESKSACVEFPQNERADGKKWAQVVQESGSSISMTRH